MKLITPAPLLPLDKLIRMQTNGVTGSRAAIASQLSISITDRYMLRYQASPFRQLLMSEMRGRQDEHGGSSLWTYHVVEDEEA